MQMSEAERATSAAALGPAIIDLIAGHVGGDEGDIASVGLTACIAAAIALMAPRIASARAAVALVTCVAEAVADDAFGAAA